MAVPTAMRARIGTQRTCVRRTGDAATAPVANLLVALPVDAVDVPVSRRGRRRVFHRRLDDRRASRGERRAEGGSELVGRSDEDALGAVAPGDLREVGTVAGAVRLAETAEFPSVVH